MPQIDPSGLAAVIRRQVASLARPANGEAAAPTRTPRDPTAARKAGGGEAQPDIASLVARRVQALDPADPDRPRKAFRVFLESVLLAEFGDDLINDAGFHRLVEDVHAQMAADPELSGKVALAATRMLAEAQPPGR
jgi:hypothetical protein